MKTKIGVVLSLVAGANSLLAAESVPNRIIVKFKEVPGASTQSLVHSLGAKNLGVVSELVQLGRGLAQVRYSTQLTALEASKVLREEASVEWAQPDYILSIPVEKKNSDSANIFPQLVGEGGSGPVAADPAFVTIPAMPSEPLADPRTGQAWGLLSIEAPEAWNIQKGSREIVVADIDTGIDYTHEDLVNNLWVNPNAAAPDRHGYDFVNNDNFPFDDQGHGSHTAGTIGATGGNGVGLSGVAQAVSIMGLKFLSGQGSGTTSDAVRAIDYAIANGARIMSNSWGGPADDNEENRALIDAVARANAADILFVAAAGNDMGQNNDTRPVYPAAIRQDNVLTVASTKQGDGLSFFSNIGPTSVHVAAPGSGILSTTPRNSYQSQDGTSMACPHVAGLAALILSERPELTALQVKQIIMETVDVVPALRGKIVTGGRINARKAVEKARNFAI